MNYGMHEQCLICGSKNLQPLAPYQNAHLVKCHSCRFVFSQTIPTESALIAHYEHYGRDDYLSPVTIKRFHEILDDLEKFRKTNRMIDVGCGIGYFLEAAKERGWEVYGTEFTDEAVKICSDKGIKMQQGKLNPANYDSNSFDVIISIEVLEHINNPVEEVANFHSILRSVGAVYLTTPNFNSLSRKILKEKWNVISYPEHLSYYTPFSITRLFKDHGFTKKKIRTTGISITRMKSGLALSKQQAVSSSSEDEKLRRTLESNSLLRFAKSIINEALTLTESGDNLKALFVKK